MFQRGLKTGYFVLEWLNIWAAAYYGNYIYFLMRAEFGFANRDNLLLAGANGFVYVIFAWVGGHFAQKHGYFLALRVGYGVMGLSLLAGTQAQTVPAHVVVILIWHVGMCFTWPTLEALVSEGEDRKGLGTMVGVYNIVWASGAAAAYFTGGAVLEIFGHGSLFWLPAILHGAQFAMTVWLEGKAGALAANAARETGRVTPEGKAESRQISGDLSASGSSAGEDTPTPMDPHDVHVPLARRKRFLRLAWISNPFAYIAMNTVLPLIPDVASRLKLTTTLAGIVCSVWMFARLFAFICLWRWTGWHYRFGWLAGAYVAMVGCFAALLLVENLVVVVIGQFIFGWAVGLIYYSSLFYAMDVGETKGVHGGFHEALIGVGLFAGPAVGAAAAHVFPAAPRAGVLAVSAMLTIGMGIVLWIGIGRGRKRGELAQKSLS